jgi:hypothetical protein
MRQIFANASSSITSALLALLLCVTVSGCGATPQLGGDEECLGAADALWTAIGAQSPDLVNSSAAAVERLHNEGKMPDDAFESISEIVTMARAAEWSDARASLKSFVKGQRRAKKS